MKSVCRKILWSGKRIDLVENKTVTKVHTIVYRFVPSDCYELFHPIIEDISISVILWSSKDG